MTVDDSTQTSAWTRGLYAPLTEELTALELPVTGTLPVELDGRFVRNGPNPVKPVDPKRHHWFAGDAMVHGIRLRNGKAEWYRNRWVRSTAVSEALGEDPKPGERHGGDDNANTNVIGLGGRTYALVEGGARPVELSDELETVCHSDFGGTLPNGFTAHPKVDPATGALHAVTYHWWLPYLQYVVVGADGLVQRVEKIHVEDGPMVHDCSITERWMVIYDLPVTFHKEAAENGDVSSAYRWKEDRAARIGLVPLGGAGADVRWFDVAPCWMFHPLNAFDDGDNVVIDIIRYDRMFDANPLFPEEAPPLLWRWTVDASTGLVYEQQLSDIPLEYPRVDERVVGREHTVGWAMVVGGHDRSKGIGGRLARVDGSTGDIETVDLGRGRLGGEWVMVPRGDGQEDGWLLSLVYDKATDRSDLVVLDAAEPAAGVVASVHLPTRVPLGFHGNWLPND